MLLALSRLGLPTVVTGRCLWGGPAPAGWWHTCDQELWAAPQPLRARPRTVRRVQEEEEVLFLAGLQAPPLAHIPTLSGPWQLLLASDVTQ